MSDVVAGLFELLHRQATHVRLHAVKVSICVESAVVGAPEHKGRHSGGNGQLVGKLYCIRESKTGEP